MHVSLSLLAANYICDKNAAADFTSSMPTSPTSFFFNYYTMIMWAMKSIKVFLTEFSSFPLVCKPCKDSRLITYLYRTQGNIYLAGFRTAKKQSQ